MRKCKQCEASLPEDSFYRFGTNRNLSSYCKACTKVKNRQDHLKRQNFELGIYERLFEKQEGRCWICKSERSFQEGKKQGYKFCIDHDHITGKVRGLLCHNCNQGIAKFKDNIQNLRAAIEYLSQV